MKISVNKKLIYNEIVMRLRQFKAVDIGIYQGEIFANKKKNCWRISSQGCYNCRRDNLLGWLSPARGVMA